MKYKGSQINLQYKYLGREPEFDGSLLEGSKLLEIYNWYSQMMDLGDSSEFLMDYCKQNNLNPNIKGHNIPTYGWIARILTKGGKISDGYVQKLHNYIKSLNHFESHKKTPEQPSVVYNDPLDEIIPQIDKIIYDGENLDSLNLSNISKKNKIFIIETLEKNRNEIIDAIRGDDPQLVESYSIFTKDYLDDICNKIQEAISYINNWKDVNALKESIKIIKNKSKRVIERQKIKEQIKERKAETKKFKDFKYLEEDKSLNISSILPKKIVGSKILYLFDTNRNIFYKLAAEDNKTLDISRTSILNIDENKSMAKKIGRNTKEYLEKFKLLNKKSKGNFLDMISTKPTKISSRTTLDYLILDAQS